MTETAAHKAWVQAHPERRREAQRRWRQKNRTYQPQWRRQHPAYHKLTSRQYRRQRAIEQAKAKLWAQHLLRVEGVKPQQQGWNKYQLDSWNVVVE
jgi:hypothetical protein